MTLVQQLMKFVHQYYPIPLKCVTVSASNHLFFTIFPCGLYCDIVSTITFCLACASSHLLKDIQHGCTFCSLASRIYERLHQTLLTTVQCLLFSPSVHYGAIDDECRCIILSDGNDLVNVCVWLLAVF